MFDWFLALGLNPTNKDAYLTRFFFLWIMAALDIIGLLAVWIATAWKR